MSLKFRLKTEISASAETIYNAWLDSEEHERMTDGAYALASPLVGAEHKAHGDYIWGKNLELVPNKKIIQTWRSTGFLESDPDSILEVELIEKGKLTEIILTHSNVPIQESAVETGWEDYYFEPMKQYFEGE